MKIKLKHIIFLVAFISSQILLSQTFKTQVSKKTLGLKERLRIRFSFDRQGMDGFKPPKFTNFKVVSEPITGSNFFNNNGKISYSISYTYILIPLKAGKFTIPSATAMYKGKPIKTNTVTIKVTNTGVAKKQIKKNQQNKLSTNTALQTTANENIHLVASISNRNPYVGESVHVVYKLYINLNKAGLRNERESKTPNYNGFWKQNIQIKQLKEQKGTYQGKKMSYFIMRKDVLIPQRAGKLKITPLNLDATAVVTTGKRDYFGRQLERSLKMIFSSGNQTINVKPLPEESKPSNFSGAVGSFAFSAKSSKKVVKANESAKVTVKLQGTGNLKLIRLPKIDTPKGLEQFEPEHKELIRTRLSGMSGTITDDYTVVPQYRGKYKIPSLSFSFFNPKTEEYQTLFSAPIIIDVPNGKFPEEEDNTIVSTKNKTVNDTDIRTIHTKTKLVAKITKANFFKSNLFWFLLLFPFLAIPFGIYIGKKKRERDGDVVGNKRRKADKLAKKYLANAKKELGNKEPFYIALEKALHNYLKATLQVETSEISNDKISVILTDKKVNKQTIARFTKVLDDCNFARYTPITNLQMEQEYTNAVEIISDLDKQLARS